MCPALPANGIDQQLAGARADELAAGLEVLLRVGELTLELGDAVDQQAQIVLRKISSALTIAHGVSLPGSLAISIARMTYNALDRHGAPRPDAVRSSAGAPGRWGRRRFDRADTAAPACCRRSQNRALAPDLAWLPPGAAGAHGPGSPRCLLERFRCSRRTPGRHRADRGGPEIRWYLR